MVSKNKNIQGEKFAEYAMTLKNAETQSDISPLMAERGYNTDAFAEGNALLQDAVEKEEDYMAKSILAKNSSKDSIEKRAQYRSIYMSHRKLAKVIYRDDGEATETLGLKGVTPVKFSAWYAMATQFYKTVNTNTTIKTKFMSRVPQSEVDDILSLGEAVKTADALRFKHKGEVEDATERKNLAANKITQWMKEFYLVAKMALKDRPQLLEALKIVVKS